MNTPPTATTNANLRPSLAMIDTALFDLVDMADEPRMPHALRDGLFVLSLLWELLRARLLGDALDAERLRNLYPELDAIETKLITPHALKTGRYKEGILP